MAVKEDRDCSYLSELHDTTSDITVSKNPHVQQEFQISGLYEFRSYAQLKLFKFEGVEKNLTVCPSYENCEFCYS